MPDHGTRAVGDTTGRAHDSSPSEREQPKSVEVVVGYDGTDRPHLACGRYRGDETSAEETDE